MEIFKDRNQNLKTIWEFFPSYAMFQDKAAWEKKNEY